MSYLKSAREKMGLSQSAAALRLGIGRQKLNRLELGKALATASQARQLRELYGIAVLSVEQLCSGQRMLERAGLRCFELEPVNPEPWGAAEKFWGERLQLEPGLWLWMSQFIPAHSSRECYGWGQFAARGARPMLGNPLQWGFDQHVPVDSLGNLLAAGLLPALNFQSPELDFVIWPQVWLCTGEHTFRVDGLLFLRLGKRRFWLVVEFDGDGHRANGDAFRSAQLGMLEVRVTGEEIRSGRAFELVVQRALEAVERGPIVAPPPGFKSGWRRGRRR